MVPYRRGRGNYYLLKEICGAQTHPEYNKALGCFKVARVHLGALLAQLPAELGQLIEVTLHGASQTRCVEAAGKRRLTRTGSACARAQASTTERGQDRRKILVTA